MNLILADPMPDDAKAFFALTSETSIKTEFPNFGNNSIEVAQSYIDYFIKVNNDVANPCFLRLVKLTPHETEQTVWNDNNSKLIGFVVLHNTASTDKLVSGGFNQTLSFAISETRRKKGIMTMALEMTFEKMVERGYNLVPAIVKGNNIASMRVLEKCGFKKVESLPGNVFLKRLNMNRREFETIFER